MGSAEATGPPGLSSLLIRNGWAREGEELLGERRYPMVPVLETSESWEESHSLSGSFWLTRILKR